jgi:hypothetical protein
MTTTRWFKTSIREIQGSKHCNGYYDKRDFPSILLKDS